MTVQQLMDRMRFVVMEDKNYSTGLWSTSQIIDFINDAQSDFCVDSQCLKKYAFVPGGAVPGQRLYADPTDSMQIDRIDFNGKPLYRASRVMLDLEDRQWKTKPGTPKRYHTDLLNVRKTFEFDRVPTAAMSGVPIGVLSTYLPTDVTSTTSTIDLPDYALPYLQWNVLSSMFAGQNENQDTARAMYCEQRYQFGISLFRRLMGEESAALNGG